LAVHRRQQQEEEVLSRLLELHEQKEVTTTVPWLLFLIESSNNSCGGCDILYKHLMEMINRHTHAPPDICGMSLRMIECAMKMALPEIKKSRRDQSDVWMLVRNIHF